MANTYSPRLIHFCPFCGAKMERIQRAEIGDVLAERGYVRCAACNRVFKVCQPGQPASSIHDRGR